MSAFFDAALVFSGTCGTLAALVAGRGFLQHRAMARSIRGAAESDVSPTFSVSLVDRDSGKPFVALLRGDQLLRSGEPRTGRGETVRKLIVHHEAPDRIELRLETEGGDYRASEPRDLIRIIATTGPAAIETVYDTGADVSAQLSKAVSSLNPTTQEAIARWLQPKERMLALFDLGREDGPGMRIVTDQRSGRLEQRFDLVSSRVGCSVTTDLATEGQGAFFARSGAGDTDRLSVVGNRTALDAQHNALLIPLFLQRAPVTIAPLHDTRGLVGHGLRLLKVSGVVACLGWVVARTATEYGVGGSDWSRDAVMAGAISGAILGALNLFQNRLRALRDARLGVPSV